MDTRDSLDGIQGQPLMSREQANDICAAWRVPPIEEDVVSDLSLANHLCQELGLDSRTGLRAWGCRCGDLVARLLDYLETKEEGGQAR